jgi:hypothetical protein
MQRLTRHAMACATAFVLAACGGGGGGSGAGVDTTAQAQGFYNGTTSTGRNFIGVVTAEGRLYALYSQVNDTLGLIAGVVVANGSATDNVYRSSTARDFNFELPASTVGSITANVSSQQSLNGTASAGGNAFTFEAAYETDYELTPSLGTVAGTYTGEVVAAAGQESSTVTIASNGSLTATSSGGCSANGSVAVASSGNLYTVRLDFGNGCLAQGQTFRGHAVYDDGLLIAIATDSGLTDGVLFLGNK